MEKKDGVRTETRARKPFLTALVSVLVAALAAFVLLPVTGNSKVYAKEAPTAGTTWVDADSWDSLRRAINDTSNSGYIRITKNIVAESKTINVSRDVYIAGPDGENENVKIWRKANDADFTMFTVGSDGDLTLGKNLTLSGQTGTCSDTSCVDVDQYKQTSQSSGDWTGTIGNIKVNGTVATGSNLLNTGSGTDVTFTVGSDGLLKTNTGLYVEFKSNGNPYLRDSLASNEDGLVVEFSADKSTAKLKSPYWNNKYLGSDLYTADTPYDFPVNGSGGGGSTTVWVIDGNEYNTRDAAKNALTVSGKTVCPDKAAEFYIIWSNGASENAVTDGPTKYNAGDTPSHDAPAAPEDGLTFKGWKWNYNGTEGSSADTAAGTVPEGANGTATVVAQWETPAVQSAGTWDMPSHNWKAKLSDFVNTGSYLVGGWNNYMSTPIGATGDDVDIVYYTKDQVLNSDGSVHPGAKWTVMNAQGRFHDSNKYYYMVNDAGYVLAIDQGNGRVFGLKNEVPPLEWSSNGWYNYPGNSNGRMIIEDASATDSGIQLKKPFSGKNIYADSVNFYTEDKDTKYHPGSSGSSDPTPYSSIDPSWTAADPVSDTSASGSQGCDGNEGCKTWTSSEFSSGTATNPKGFFVQIEAGGSATIDGATLSGFITDNTVNHVAPVVANGKPTEGGTSFTLKSGDIKDNIVGYQVNNDELQWPAHVLGKEDETGQYRYNGYLGREIAKNTETAGGVILTGGSKGVIQGGSISNNRADTGGIIVQGSGHNNGDTVSVENEADRSELRIYGGNIDGNVGLHHAGGLLVYNGAAAQMEGGSISKNFSWHKGGGVFVAEEALGSMNLTGNGPACKKVGDAMFVMKGGTIDGNVAIHRGGGIEVMSNHVVLQGGSISNNNSRTLGGGIYVEGDAGRMYQLYVSNGCITGNKATMAADTGHTGADGNTIQTWPKGDNTCGFSNAFEDLPAGRDVTYLKGFWGGQGQGGGLWLCPLGGNSTFSIGEGHKVAIYGNTAAANSGVNTGNGTDVFVERPRGNIGNGFHAVKLTTANSFVLEGSKPEVTMKDNFSYSGKMGLTNNSSDAAQSCDSSLSISGNTAALGGGIAANGTVVFGEPEDTYRTSIELDVTKNWDAGTEQRDVTLTLYAEKDGQRVQFTDTYNPLEAASVKLNGIVDTEVLSSTDPDNPTGENQYDPNATAYESSPWVATFGLPLAIEINGVMEPLFKVKVNGESLSPNNRADLKKIYEAYKGQSNVQAEWEDWKLVIVETDKDGNEVEYSKELNGQEIRLNLAVSAPEDETQPVTYKDIDGNSIMTVGTYTTNFKLTDGIVNKGEDQPGPEKYINNKVHQTLEGFDEIFTYSVMAYVPNDATEFVISDTLEDTLEFVDSNGVRQSEEGFKANDVVTNSSGKGKLYLVVTDTNDHMGDGTGTVSKTNTMTHLSKPINTDGKIQVEGQTITVTVDESCDIEKARGKWVVLSFDSAYKSSYYDLETVQNDASWLDKDANKQGGSEAEALYAALSSAGVGTIEKFVEDDDHYYAKVDGNKYYQTCKGGDGKWYLMGVSGGWSTYTPIGGETLPTGADNEYDGAGKHFNGRNASVNYINKDDTKNIEITTSDEINYPVLSGQDTESGKHEGTANQADYTVKRGNSATNSYKTNIVTVEPDEVQFKAEKKWLHQNGNEYIEGGQKIWPKDENNNPAKVTFTLWKIKVDANGNDVVDADNNAVEEQIGEAKELTNFGTVTFDKQPKLKGYRYEVREEVSVVAAQNKGSETNEATDTDPETITYKFTNQLGEEPEVEKYVNNKVHQTLDTFDETFEYSIMAFVPKDATEVTLTDTLEGTLMFVDAKGNPQYVKNDAGEVVANVDFNKAEGTNYQSMILNDGDTGFKLLWEGGNNHNGNGSGRVSGHSIDAKVVGETRANTNKEYWLGTDGQNQLINTPIATEGKIKVENNKLTVVIDDADEIAKIQGKWVVLSFNAAYRPDYYDLTKVQEDASWSEDSENKSPDGTGAYNGSVTGQNPHHGTKNQGEYTVKRGNNVEGTYKTNVVTVEPAVEDLTITKQWEGDTAEDRPAEADFKAALKVQSVKDGKTTDLAPQPEAAITDNGDNTWTATWTNLPKLEGVTYQVAETQLTGYDAPTGSPAKNNETITNKKTIDEKPEIEKYVDKDVHSDLVYYDKEFTYDIIAYVPTDATGITITDDLDSKLAFVSTKGEIEESAVAIDKSNLLAKSAAVEDGATRSVEEAGTKITATANIQDQKLTVTVDNIGKEDGQQNIGGKSVRVTFKAKIKANADGTYTVLKETDLKAVNDDTPVITELAGEAGHKARDHKGIKNQAKYTITTDNDAEGNPKYPEKPSNEVTVVPETTKLEAEKKWVNADASTTWPTGVSEVEIEVLKGDVKVDTITLTSDKPKNTSKELPKLKNETYTLGEVSVDGYVTSSADLSSLSEGCESGKEFTNTQIKDGAVVLEAVKKLTKAADAPADTANRSLKDKEFSFELYETDNTFEVADEAAAIQTAYNTKAGKIQFSQIEYDSEGTHYYVIREVKGNDPTISKYAQNDIKVTVTVKQENDSLKATPVYDAADKTFTNEYTDYNKPEIVLTAKKTIDGETPATEAAGVFSFELYEGTNKKDTKTNSNGGVVTFDKITYTKDDKGEHTYTIKEVIPAGVNEENEDDLYKYDTTEYKVTVNVTVTGTKVEAKVTKVDDVDATDTSGVVFNNTTVTRQPSDVSITIEGNKELLNAPGNLTNKTLAANDFEFALYQVDAADAKVDETAEPVDTAKNDADGKFKFKEITYTEEDANKTFYYVVKELIGSDETIELTSPANHEYRVTVNVTKDGYTMKTDLTDNKVNVGTFTNTYTQPDAKPVELTLMAKKSLENDKLEDDAFTFELKEGNKLLATAKNKGENVTFEAINFSKKGKHTYTIKEKKVDGDGITYDGSTKTVVVDVAETTDANGDKILTIDNEAESVTKDAGTFTNVKGQVEKYIEKDVDATLKNPKEVFTYDVIGYVAKDATKVTVTDTLINALEFTDTNGNKTTEGKVTVTAVEAKDTNDHKVGGTVSAAGTKISEYDAKIAGKTLTVTIDNAAELAKLQGKWVQVTFNAHIAKDYESLEELKEDADFKVIDDNKTVKGGAASHDGLTNKAEYTVELPNDGKVEDESNTVTVEPVYKEIELKKIWKDSDDNGLAEEDIPNVDVVLEIKADDKSFNPAKTVTLNNSNKWTASVKNLPKYALDDNGRVPDGAEPIEYTAVENDVPEGYEYNQDGFTAVNKKKTPEKPEIEKYVNKKDATPEQRDGTVHTDLSAFDEVYTYDIQAYITNDAKYVVVTDELNSVLEFVGGAPTAVVVKDGEANGKAPKLSKTGTALAETAYTVDADAWSNNKLVLTMGSDTEDAPVLADAGKWVQITFDAKIKDTYRSIEALKGAGADVWVTETNNGPIDDADTTTEFSGATKDSHEGIVNEASYTINKKAGVDVDNEWQYSDKSNKVTVQPKTTKVYATKTWEDEKDNAVDWPADYNEAVTVNVLNGTTKVDTLTIKKGKDGKATVEVSKELPVLTGVDYSVEEVAIPGYTQNGSVTGSGTEDDPYVFKNQKNGGPQIEKYVNDNVHQNLEGFDKLIKYDIIAFVPEDADEIEINDKLVNALEFANGKGDQTKAAVASTNKDQVVTSVVVKDNNDHKVNGTVKGEDTALGKKAAVTVDGKDLKVAIADAKAYRGKYIQVTFWAKYTQETIDAAKVADSKKVTGNGAVLEGANTHTGTTNDASYKIKVDNDWSSDHKSNTVTVESKTVTLEAEKQWKNADGSTTWPEGVTEVKINVLKSTEGSDATEIVKDKDNNNVQIVLTSAKEKNSIKLPKLIGVTYTLDEVKVPGYTTTTEDGKTFVNTEEKPEIEKYVNKKSAAGEAKDGGVHTDLSAFDEVYTYDIQAYITKDAKYVEVTDELKSVLEFVGDAPTAVVVKDGETDGTAPKLSKAGAAFDEYTIDAAAWKAGKLALNIGSDAEDASVLDIAGKWLQITFDAKIKDTYRSVEALKEEGVNAWEEVIDNTPIDDAKVDAEYSDATVDNHEGIENDASYTINKKAGVDVDNEWEYTAKSNKVTVQPKTTKVYAKKTWLDEKGNAAAWPTDVTSVTVNVYGADENTAVDTITLTDVNTKASNELPVLTGVEYTVDEVAIPGYSEVGSIQGSGTEDDPYIFTNKKNGGPQIEKYVNDNVHQNLEEFDKAIKYDIIAFVPKDADELEINDTLVNALEYADRDGKASEDKASVVTAVVAKNTNDRKVNGTVKATDGTPLGNAAVVDIDGKALKVSVANAKPYRGKYIQVTFWAKYTQETIDAAKVADSKKVIGNGAVLEGANTHTGTTNDASYKIKVGNDWSSDNKSNTVTVEAKTVKLEAEKKWKNVNGSEADWPEDVNEVTINVLKGETVVDTIKLTSEEPKKSSKELPKLTGITYKLDEVEVPGYTTTVDGNIFTNTKNDTKKDVKISKTDLDGTEVEGAVITVKDADGNEVETWISTTESHVTKLEPGTYTLVEEVAPVGYKKVTTEITFTVDADGKVTVDSAVTDGIAEVREDETLILKDAPEKPEIEKYVNKAVHQDIQLGDTFTYDIIAYVTEDADTVTITDELNEKVKFAQNPAVKVVDLGEEEPNHKVANNISGTEISADASVKAIAGTPVTFTETHEDKVLKVNIADATPYQKHWIKVTFNAQLDAATVKEAEDAYKTITANAVEEDRAVKNVGNDPLDSKEDHTGVPNSASYEIGVRKVFLDENGKPVKDDNGKIKREENPTPSYSDKSNTVTVKPGPVKYDVQVSKTNINGEEIEGAHIQILKNGNVVEEWNSVKDETKLVKLEPGTYVLKETKVPDEDVYILASDITFIVDEYGKVKVADEDVDKVTMVDEYTSHTVKISKSELSKDGKLKEIPGAVITVTGENEFSETWTSSDKPYEMQLKPGKYTMVEVVAPEGYQTVTTAIEFEVDKDGNVKILTASEAFGESGAVRLADTDHLVLEDAPIKPVDVVLNAGKTLVDTSGQRKIQSGEFTFTLTGEGVSQTKTNAADGSVTFDAINFGFGFDETGKAISTPVGTHTYTITETRGTDESIVYDTTIKTVTVNITQEGNVLKATPVYAGGEAAFTNKVIQPGEVKAEFNGTKKLYANGNETAPAEGEFSFTVSAPDGSVKTVANAADGSIDFGTYTYSEAGTYTYTIAEVAGDDDTVTYDNSKYTVTVVVTEAEAEVDEETGEVTKKLEANVVYPEGGVTFTNYKVDEKEVVISKTDMTTGRELPGAQLTITDSKGNTKDEWTWISTTTPHTVKLAPGTYTLTESQAPLGYNIAEAKIFEVDENGLVGIEKVVMVDSSNKVQDKFDVTVVLEKTWKDLQGNIIEWPKGAEVEFTLQYYDRYDNKWVDYAPYGTAVKTTLTAAKTSDTFDELPAEIDGATAQYRAVETKIEGYTQATSTATNFAEKNGVMSAVNIPETPDEFEVLISKNSLGGSEIEGAEIVVYKADGSVADKWTSTTKAHQLTLKPGSYTMVETVAPAGFQKVTTEMTFTVDENGKVTLVTTTVDNGGRIKVMDGNHVVLEDAPVPNTPEKTKNDEPTTVRKETPNTPSTTRRVVTTPSQAQTSKATSTGDSNNTALWIVLAAAAAAAIAGVAVMLRRRRED